MKQSDPARAGHEASTPHAPWRRAAEVFLVFLRLGLSAFGGPVAHLAHFRAEFVERRRWLSEGSYGALVALCQFLPGPSSSQTGLALGLLRAGWPGALAAWLGFTLPSALLMVLIAYGLAGAPASGSLLAGAVQGLKVAAVAIVAQAVWTMGRSLCPDGPRRALALVCAAIALALPGPAGQAAILLLAALCGAWLLPAPAQQAAALPDFRLSRRTGWIALAAFLIPLLLLPLAAAVSGGERSVWGLADGVYRAGALVFGGGHVVLPLLESAVVPGGWVAADPFLAGYGAVQAMPGPLFSVAAYLGALLPGAWGGIGGAVLLLVLVFAPGMLLLIAALPFWARLQQRPGLRRVAAGLNAAVVGLLLAALWHPIGSSAIHGPADALLALALGALLFGTRLSPVWAVGLAALAGMALSAWR